uniref:Pleckstrin-like plant domain-containing protein n=1 Tax=Aegilops tauschii subsp. strangulata TaxID=200361 RepID=A0A453CBF5_AEGTS
MEPDHRGLMAIVREEPPPSEEPMDLLSSAWCSSAIQVLQMGPKEEDRSLALVEHPVMGLDDDRRDLSQLQRNDRSLVVDDSGFGGAAQPQWKYEDLKSWIWLQKAIHPELDYDNKKKWLPRKMAAPWSGISLKKWVKERKQKRKEEARLHKAEVHAAVSVAGVAAVLAAIAAENSAPAARGSASASMRETAVASAAALVAAQCAKVAEAAGATRDQVSRCDMVPKNSDHEIISLRVELTALRGAAALRGRRGGSGGHGQGERADQGGTAPWQDDLDFDFNYARSKAALAKGDELFVAMPDGKWKLHTVSAATDRNGKVVLRIKKMNLVMQAFSNAKECVVEDVRPCAPEKASREEDATYPVEVRTSRGKVELRADDYAVYKRWVTTVTHMLTSSTAITMRN